jgi:hypothetical protein
MMMMMMRRRRRRRNGKMKIKVFIVENPTLQNWLPIGAGSGRVQGFKNGK